ncbi:hypothetical protein [Burkholderia gladioli]|uniref:hypothetical protein n=1 Tax=Burkholderia gladioli TaxID=28095 RepID=UPI001641FF3C|nr:hypothetical protein [Burkholderia gladioli]
MMPRISPKRRAAFDILDWLFFNQTWFLRLSEDDETLYEGSPRAGELIALYKISRRVNEEVASTGATGIAAQALKHTVYCILEAGFTDNLQQKGRSGHADRFDLTDERGMPISKLAETIDPALAARVHEFEQQTSMALIAAFGDKAHGICSNTALTIAATVGTAFNEAPAAVKYRLTERVFILEFMNAPVKFLSWMYRIGILTSKKFIAGRATRDITEDFKARVGLLCEFTLMRDFIARLPGKNTARQTGIRRLQEELGDKLSDAAWIQLQEENDFYMRLDRHKTRQPGTLIFDLTRLTDEAYMHEFLERFAENHWRSRFWTGPQQSWTGVVGAGMIWAYHSLVDSQRKITRNGNNYSKSGEPVAQEQTVAQHICKNLNEHGLDCRPGSLYETFTECYMNEPAGLYHRVTVYHALQQELDAVFPMQIYDAAYLGVITTSTP